MQNSGKTAQQGKKGHKVPSQLAYAWAETTQLLEVDLGEGKELYQQWKLKASRPYKYDLDVEVPPPDGWSAADWLMAITNIKKGMRRGGDSDSWVSQWGTEVMDHVFKHVRTLAREKLLPDWAANNPLDTIPKELLTTAENLWEYHNGEVWLCVVRYPEYPVALHNTVQTIAAMRGIRQNVTALVEKTPAWAGIEVTKHGYEDIVTAVDGEWEVSETIERGTGWHAGCVFGPDVDRSRSIYSRPARNIFDVIYWMNYHQQSVDARLKVVVHTTSRKNPNAVMKFVQAMGERRGAWLTLYLPRHWAWEAAEGVADGFKSREGLAALGRTRMPSSYFTVGSRKLNALRRRSASPTQQNADIPPHDQTTKGLAVGVT
ncbi:hypothetical protein ACFQDE_09565 [Deinococcus caeni]|uniref:Uncharacterized protein n=2 Tax=Deinococcus caeni TaxID=569127 RepID=A0ABP9UF50_9DEIO